MISNMRFIEKIWCVDDGRSYNTIEECASHYHITPQTLSDLLNGKTDHIKGCDKKFRVLELGDNEWSKIYNV